MDTLQLVLRRSNGAIRIALKKTAFILGLEPQTIRNRMSKQTWPLDPIREGRSVYFHAVDVAGLIDAGKCSVNAERQSRRGTSTAQERQAARACGLTVREWRAQQGGVSGNHQG
jgi:hypothetical protein